MLMKIFSLLVRTSGFVAPISVQGNCSKTTGQLPERPYFIHLSLGLGNFVRAKIVTCSYTCSCSCCSSCCCSSCCSSCSCSCSSSSRSSSSRSSSSRTSTSRSTSSLSILSLYISYSSIFIIIISSSPSSSSFFWNASLYLALYCSTVKY